MWFLPSLGTDLWTNPRQPVVLTRILLVTHGLTDAQRSMRLASPADHHHPPAEARRLDMHAPPDRVVLGPGIACAEAAGALGVADGAVAEAALADIDLGRWAGRSVAGLFRDEPDAVAAWLRDPTVAPHGGESAADLIARVGGWLATQLATAGTTMCVVTPWVARAGVAAALGSEPTSFLHLDVEPFSVAELRSDGHRLMLRRFNEPTALPS